MRASVESPETVASEIELDDARGWFMWLPPTAPRLPVGGQPPEGPDADKGGEGHWAGPHPGWGGVWEERVPPTGLCFRLHPLISAHQVREVQT